MVVDQISNELNISVLLVKALIAEQFPQWHYLTIAPVKYQGHDNRTFRLGETMLVRMPSATIYAEKVQKEQEWLPVLAKDLSVHIPHPIALGKPSKDYPFYWSIYQWINGDTVDTLKHHELPQFALDVAHFLNELHEINTTECNLVPGIHNFYRGASPVVYDAEVQSAFVELQDIIDVQAASAVWQKAGSSTWANDPVWIHGDFSPGNILVKDGKLSGVIDFGGMAVGDPACDLVIAWTFLNGESREIFRTQIELDANTWNRARGWALWKAMITLVALEDKYSPKALKQKQIINDILLK
jgi:aminoglycoside phosphotransferase (APT) family kinase protein